MKIKEGDKLPEFTLPAHTGETISLNTYHNQNPVVLFFYPKDDSPVCTKEACSFRDAYQDFVDLGAVVLGISSDSGESHEKFANKHRLPYPLLVDEGGKFRKTLGIPKTMGIVDGRVTLVMDKEGTVRKIFSSQLASNRHMEEALDIIKQLNS